MKERLSRGDFFRFAASTAAGVGLAAVGYNVLSQADREREALQIQIQKERREDRWEIRVSETVHIPAFASLAPPLVIPAHSKVEEKIFLTDNKPEQIKTSSGETHLVLKNVLQVIDATRVWRINVYEIANPNDAIVTDRFVKK